MKIKQVLNKYERIINIVIFPLEFMISLLLAYSSIRFIMLRNYEQIISIKHMIMILLFGVVTLIIIIYNCIKNKDKFEKIIIGFLIPIGMLYLIYMIPSHVPDETSHLWRSYEISEGKLISDKIEATEVPEDLKFKIRGNVDKYSNLYENLGTKTDYSKMVKVNNTAKTYPFILYIFPAIGFWIARVFSLNIIVGCYLAKMMNFIIFLIVTYYTIKIIPFGKCAMTSVLFMPMFLHQATSTSADCIVNLSTMFFTAFSMYLIFKKTAINKKEIAGFIILSAIIALVKYVYLPLVGLGCILTFSKNINKKEKIFLILTSIFIALIIAIGYFKSTNGYVNSFEEYMKQNNVNFGEQLIFIKNNPKDFCKILIKTLHDKGDEYIYIGIGRYLGWICIEVPQITITTYLFVMLFSCFLEDNKIALSNKQKLYCLLIIFGTILLVITGMYLTWTTVGANIVEGVQGRYFIPVVFLLLLCMCKKQNYIRIKNIQYKLPIILCLLNLSAVYSIYKFFR